MGCAVSVYLDKRAAEVAPVVAPIPLQLDTVHKTVLHKHTQCYTSVIQYHNTDKMYTCRFLPDTHGGLVLIPKNLCLSKYGSIDILAYYRHCIHQVLHFWKTSKKKNIQFCFLQLLHCSLTLAGRANGCQLIVDTTKLSQLREGTASPTRTV